MSSSMTGGNWIYATSPHMQDDRTWTREEAVEKLRELARTKQPTIARARRALRLHTEETVWRMLVADPELDVAFNDESTARVVPIEKEE